jgi:hypothetical protein
VYELRAPAHLKPSVMVMLPPVQATVSPSRNREFVEGFAGMQIGTMRNYYRTVITILLLLYYDYCFVITVIVITTIIDIIIIIVIIVIIVIIIIFIIVLLYLDLTQY